MSSVFHKPWFDELPVVGILRGFGPAAVENILQAAARGGLRNIEITMNSPGAADLIRLACRLVGDQLNVGAGTVLSEGDLTEARAAGATFIVTPVVNPTVIRQCVDWSLPIYPGACSPTEVVRAWELGATMVKIFPADHLGPAYLKSLKGPLPHIRLMPTGGVSLDTLEAYAAAGAEAFGVGSPLFDAQRVRDQDWNWIQSQCTAFGQRWRQRKERT